MSGQELERGDIPLVCIACPIGCRLVIRQVSPLGGSAGQEITVSGNRCPKGEAYGREEILSPRRMVTAVVPTDSPDFPCAPVRTDGPIPRGLTRELLRKLYASTVRLPVRTGDVFVPDFHGARIIFTRTLPPDDVPSIGEAGAEPEGDDEVARF